MARIWSFAPKQLILCNQMLAFRFLLASNTVVDILFVVCIKCNIQTHTFAICRTDPLAKYMHINTYMCMYSVEAYTYMCVSCGSSGTT